MSEITEMRGQGQIVLAMGKRPFRGKHKMTYVDDRGATVDVVFRIVAFNIVQQTIVHRSALFARNGEPLEYVRNDMLPRLTVDAVVDSIATRGERRAPKAHRGRKIR